MQNQPALGLAADSDFFDWGTGDEDRFFLDQEVIGAGGYRIRSARPTAPAPLPYASELPRSAS